MVKHKPGQIQARGALSRVADGFAKSRLDLLAIVYGAAPGTDPVDF
jgi:hypothetical protein